MSGVRVVLPAALVFVLGVASALARAEDLGAALDRIYEEHDLQTVLPSLDDEPVKPTGFASPAFLWPLVGIVVAVLLVAWLVTVDWERLREMRRGRPRGDAGDDEGSVRAENELAAADALAGQGWYAGAIHALLVGVLRGLADARRWPPAATPREIAATHMPTEDLRMLVLAAEMAHFAGRPASEADYLTCRARALRLRSKAVTIPPRPQRPAPNAPAS